MTKISTVTPKGDHWLVHCTDYDIQFQSVQVSIAANTGDILETASAKVSATTPTGGPILGILASDTDGTGWVRVMVRGNPSQVNGKELNYEDATKADIDALLEDKGIIVTNDW